MYASHYFEALLRVSCFVIAIMVLRATRIVPERYSSAAPYGLFAALLVVVALSPHVNIATLVDAYAAKPTPAEKHSGIYLSGRVWDRYFETLERTL